MTSVAVGAPNSLGTSSRRKVSIAMLKSLEAGVALVVGDVPVHQPP